MIVNGSQNPLPHSVKCTHHWTGLREDLNALNNRRVTTSIDELQHTTIRGSRKEDIELHPTDSLDSWQDSDLAQIWSVSSLDDQRLCGCFDSPMEKGISRGEGNSSFRELCRVWDTASRSGFRDIMTGIGLPDGTASPLVLEGTVVELLAYLLHRKDTDSAHSESGVRCSEDSINLVVAIGRDWVGHGF